MIPRAEDRPTMSIEEAGAALDLGRSASYEAARRGELPTISIGRRKVVPTAALRRLLCLDEPPDPDHHPTQEAQDPPVSAGVVLPFANHRRPGRSSP